MHGDARDSGLIGIGVRLPPVVSLADRVVEDRGDDAAVLSVLRVIRRDRPVDPAALAEHRRGVRAEVAAPQGDRISHRLDADPLADIRNTRKIEAVVMGGKLFAKAKLNALKNPVATHK